MQARMFTATILTLFPDMFPGPLGASLLGKAMQDGRWNLSTINIRNYATDKHQTVDDTPYGGGAGLVMKADVVGPAFEAARAQNPAGRAIYLSPRGRPLTQPLAAELAQEQGVILLCGRYEGVDERVLQKHQIEEISLGDVVLTGGEIPAMALLDAVVRLIPGVLGAHESISEESFGLHEDYACLLEYPHYSKPPLWEGLNVPDVLLSGHHGNVAKWRKAQAEAITKARRPDLWDRYTANKGKRNESASDA